MLTPVKKIAFLNPYLQGGHTEIAESESAIRLIQAGKNLSIDIQVFSRSEDVYDFDPDFIIAISYQEGKLTHYPTYLALNTPTAMVRTMLRFVRNIITYDGIVTMSPGVVDWLRGVYRYYHKTLHTAYGAISVPQTVFQSCDFTKAVAAYVGTNWDGSRHRGMFDLLNDGEYLRCYGPKHSWAHYPVTLYGGEIPFNGSAIFDMYRRHAVGLCVGHPLFDAEHIANNRLFEITAASALPVCATNALTKSIYQDTVLYIDKDVTARKVANQVVDAVGWIRSNSRLAQEMARAAHTIFNQELTMEVFIQNIITMHERVLQQNCYMSVPTLIEKVIYMVVGKEDAAVIQKTVHSILNQSYSNVEVVVMTNVTDQRIADHRVHYFNPKDKEKICEYLQASAKWIGFVQAGDVLYVNHVAFLLANTVLIRREKVLTGIFSGYVEYSNQHVLHEMINDGHNIKTQNKVRIGFKWFSLPAPISTYIFNASVLLQKNFVALDFKKINTAAALDVLPESVCIPQVCEVTCAVLVS